MEIQQVVIRVVALALSISLIWIFVLAALVWGSGLGSKRRIKMPMVLGSIAWTIIGVPVLFVSAILMGFLPIE